MPNPTEAHTRGTQTGRQPDLDSLGEWSMSNDELDAVVDADHKRSRRNATWLSTGLIVVAAGAGAYTIGWLDDTAAASPVLAAVAFCLLLAIVSPMGVMALHRTRSRRWRQHHRECADLTDAVEYVEDHGLKRLLLFNFRLMDRFVATALGQAQASYVACVVAASVGLVILLAGTTAVLIVGDLSAQITAGTLTAAGAGLTGYLSATFLRTFAMTSQQMSYYYGQPLVHCYLLHAEWLAERYDRGSDADVRAATHHDLIKAALDAGHNAQNHLLDLHLALDAKHGPVPASLARQRR